VLATLHFGPGNKSYMGIDDKNCIADNTGGAKCKIHWNQFADLGSRQQRTAFKFFLLHSTFAKSAVEISAVLIGSNTSIRPQ
jgi:hypothetical protein